MLLFCGFQFVLLQRKPTCSQPLFLLLVFYIVFYRYLDSMVESGSKCDALGKMVRQIIGEREWDALGKIVSGVGWGWGGDVMHREKMVK
jgi:hypothetical protein